MTNNDYQWLNTIQWILSDGYCVTLDDRNKRMHRLIMEKHQGQSNELVVDQYQSQ